MKLIELIKQWFSTPILILTVLHLTILSGILAIGPLERFQALKQMGEKLPILTISAWATLLYLSLLASYIVLSIKFKEKLKPKFGVFWDKHKEPHCPSCKDLFSRFSTKDGAGLLCVKCDRAIYPITDEGEQLSLIEAKKRL